MEEAPRPKAAPTFFAGLKHRRVYQVVLGYAVSAWVIIQVCALVFQSFDAPKWALRAVIVLGLAGLGLALLTGWALDRRASGKSLMPGGTRALGFVLLALLPAAGLAAYFLMRPMHAAPPAAVSRPAAERAPVSAIPEKSIAVLPFENLSAEQDNAFFTDGVQDEILTDLAKVADLKVISRTSVMQYRGGAAHNLREIAAQLGVAHIVEGSVQRAGNRVRVNAQLINAQSDAHEWASDYDRPLDDVFAIQTEIAQKIAGELRARISPDEHVLMAQTPTSDVLAFQLYHQAQALDASEADSGPGARDNLLRAVDILKQAIGRDPQFLTAYCLLVKIHLDLYWEDFDHTDARRELAHAALSEAMRIQPDAGQTHLAQAMYFYHGFHDYGQALQQLELAQRSLPNSAEVSGTLANIHRRQGRFDDSIREFEQTAQLDPRDFPTLQNLAFTYEGVRRYAEASTTYTRALAVEPGDVFTREEFALLPYYQSGDLGPLHALNAAILASEPASVEETAYFRLYAAMIERDEPAAKAALDAFPAIGFADTTNFYMPKDWFTGLAARTFGDQARAQALFAAARAPVAKVTQEQPDFADAWSSLALIDAALGNKEDAVREGERGCELLPVSKDAFDGPALVANLAIVHAWTGDKAAALEEVASVANAPGATFTSGVTYGTLKRDPIWAPLQGDPRFEAIIARLAPK
jgi:TolB-like protein/Flp pilus assembly protein TadD